MSTTTYRVQGMTCGHCVGSVSREVASRALRAVALGLLDDHMSHGLVEAARHGGALQQRRLREASAAIARLVRS